MRSFNVYNIDHCHHDRPLLAVYVGNVSTEAWINSLIKSGFLPTVPHFEVFTFAVVSSTLMYLYRMTGHEQQLDDGVRMHQSVRLNNLFISCMKGFEPASVESHEFFLPLNHPS